MDQRVKTSGRWLGVHVLEDHGIARVASVEFSPDGGLVAYGTDSASVRVTELIGIEQAFGRLEGMTVGDLTLTAEEVLEAGLPVQVVEESQDSSAAAYSTLA
eukprot:scaffold206001_cov36-Prasinocladus_malaysianus.AAC.1